MQDSRGVIYKGKIVRPEVIALSMKRKRRVRIQMDDSGSDVGDEEGEISVV